MYFAYLRTEWRKPEKLWRSWRRRYVWKVLWGINLLLERGGVKRRLYKRPVFVKSFSHVSLTHQNVNKERVVRNYLNLLLLSFFFKVSLRFCLGHLKMKRVLVSCDFTTVNSFLRVFRLWGGGGKWGIGLKSNIIHLVLCWNKCCFLGYWDIWRHFPKSSVTPECSVSHLSAS